MTTYRRVCDATLPHAPAGPPLVTPEPVDASLAEHYHTVIGVLRHFEGFWRGAPELSDTARRYQQARRRAH